MTACCSTGPPPIGAAKTIASSIASTSGARILLRIADCGLRIAEDVMRRMLTMTLAAMLAATTMMRADDGAARWWAHVQALANDGMEGRNTGSPAHKRAAEYVAAQLKTSGLEPAGVGGYIQPVAFDTRKIDESKSSLALVKNGKPEPQTLGEN